MPQHWDRNPQTGDYVIEGGVPLETDSIKISAYHRLKTQRGNWLYAPDAKYGSTFHQITKNRSTGDPSLFENVANEALAPLIEEGRAEEITSEVVESNRHNVQLKSNITDSSGVIEEIALDPIGG